MRIKRYLLPALIAFISLTASCKWVEQQTGALPAAGPEPAVEFAPPMARSMVTAAPMPDALSATEQKMIRTASIKIEVRRLDKAAAEARGLAQEMGGSVIGAYSYEDNSGVRHTRLSLRVPAEKIDQAIAALKRLGRVKEEDLSARDVGEEYSDLETRLAGSRAIERRMLDLLNTKTTRLKDVLDVEKELARVREEIERMESRKRRMDSRIDMAAIEATLIEPRGFGRGIFDPISGLAQRALSAFTASLAALVIVLAAVVPWAAVILITAWIMLKGLRVYLRHKRQKRNSN